MKTHFLTSLSASFLLALFAITACTNDELSGAKTTPSPGGVSTGLSQTQIDAINSKSILLPPRTHINNRTPVTYAGTLCGNGDFTLTHSGYHTIFVPDQWDYYYLYGHAGDVLSIDGDRITCEMDLAYSLFLGTTTDNAGVAYDNGGANMTFLSIGDDEDPAACEPACFSFFDPRTTTVLPATGYYTLGVYDFIGGVCNTGPFTYVLHISGLTVGEDCDGDGQENICDPDDDNDGVLDGADTYPCSNTSAIIVIDGCSTGVPNAVLSDGSTMMDLILACAASAANHGQFVSCVSALTNAWKAAGLITGGQKGKIQSCAAGANIP